MTRVALRNNINPLMLLYRLQHSYYAKYTGFIPKDNIESETDLPEYPSAFVYDLDKLNAMHSNKLISDGQKNDEFENFIKVPEENIKVSESLREIIQKKIKQRQDDLEKGIIKTS